MRSAAEAAPSFLYLPELAHAPERFTLPPEEAHYVTRVVRARAGETLQASDGAGTLATLELEVVRPAPGVRVVSRTTVPATPGRVLLCGAPEGERGDWMVEKLAELGMTRFVPVETERARWPGRDRRERWQRLAVAAVRQSRSAWLMAVSAPVGLLDAVNQLGDVAPPGAGERWLAEPEAPLPDGPGLQALGALTGAVGGSPGFSEAEKELLLTSGFHPVALASRRLRTETAAVALAAIWAARPGGPGARLDAHSERP
jgi:16S rRNA (uracil1498-N3)-methyltransferase